MIDKEFYDKLEEYIGGLTDKKDDKKILEFVMEEIGYIPREVQDFIAEKTGLFPFTIKGTIDFYPKFKETLERVGPKEVKVCVGMGCSGRGSAKLLKKMKELMGIDVDETTEDGRFSLGTQRCFGKCAVGPNIYVDDRGYHKVEEEDLPRILDGEGF